MNAAGVVGRASLLGLLDSRAQDFRSPEIALRFETKEAVLEEIQLAHLGRLSTYGDCGRELHDCFCVVSSYSRFPMGQSAALRNCDDLSGSRSPTCIRTGSAFGIEDSGRIARHPERCDDRPFCVCSVLSGAVATRFGRSPENWSKRAGVYAGRQ